MRILLSIAALAAVLGAAAPAAAQREPGEYEPATAEETLEIFQGLGAWSSARAERWSELEALYAMTERLAALAAGTDAEASRAELAAWTTAFEAEITDTSFSVDRAPGLPRLFLLGEEGAAIRDVLYLSGDSQHRAIDRIAELGLSMRDDARAAIDGDADAANRLAQKSALVTAMRASMRELADDLSALSAAAAASDRSAVNALVARVGVHDEALRANTAAAQRAL